MVRPPSPRAPPNFNEHGDAILGSIGLDMEQIIDLKIRNVVAWSRTASASVTAGE